MAMSTEKRTARQYLKEFGASMLAYVIVLPVSLNVIQTHPEASWRFAVALAPVIPLVFALLAFIRFFRNIDELQQRIQLEALACAVGVTIIVTISYGFLENVGFQHIGVIWVTPLLIAFWGIGTAIASRRYAS